MAYRGRATLSVVLVPVGCGARTGIDGQAGAPRDAGPAVPTVPDLGEPPYRDDDGCGVLDPDAGGVVDVTFRFVDRPLDLIVLLDATRSMEPVREPLREALAGELTSDLLAAFTDLRIGVGYFADFPVGGYGRVPTPDQPGDLPFIRVLELTDDFGRAVEAVDAIPRLNGGDPPESMVEAMFQAATGQGAGIFLPPILCDDLDRERGAFCTLDERESVILLITDYLSHEGPDGAFPYDRDLVQFFATYDDALEALRAGSFRVVPLLARFRDAPASPGSLALVREQHRRFAVDTGAVSEAGEPLTREVTFPLPSASLIREVVAAVRGVRLERIDEISVALEELEGVDDGDALPLVRDVRALRATPPSGATLDGARFLDVRPGTDLTVRIAFDAPADDVGVLRLRVRFLRDGDVPVADRVVRLEVQNPDGCR